MTFALSLTQMLVFLSLYVMLSIFLSILVCVAASLCCACLVSIHVSAPYVIAGSTHELYTCLLLLQISRCLAYAAQPAMILRCISLYRFFSGCSVVPRFLSAHCLQPSPFFFAMFILRYIRLLSSDSYCSICCSSCGVSLHKNMSSAKRRLERNSGSIFTPLFSHFNLLNKYALQCSRE